MNNHFQFLYIELNLIRIEHLYKIWGEINSNSKIYIFRAFLTRLELKAEAHIPSITGR